MSIEKFDYDAWVVEGCRPNKDVKTLEILKPTDFKNIGNLSCVEILYINNIELVINVEILDLKNLKELYIYTFNPIPSFIGDFQTLEALEIVQVSNTSLNEIGKLQNLKKMRLSNCTLDNFDFIGTLRNLKNLKLTVCELKQLDFIENLTNLERLDISSNLLETLQIEPLKKLKWLNASTNRLEVVPSSISQLYELEYIDLSNNNICYFAQHCIENLVNLEYIKMSNNNLINLPIFPIFRNIKDIIMFNNQIVDIRHVFNNVTCIDNINLSNNQIIDIQYIFENLKSASTINLSHNNIRIIENFIGKSTKITSWFDISKNMPLLDVDYETYETSKFPYLNLLIVGDPRPDPSAKCVEL
jgi:Leucine-rich repeat (LRR) protein